ncbi:MAG: hypothetical protein WCT04_18380 [Planctomycetota bacterium]
MAFTELNVVLPEELAPLVDAIVAELKRPKGKPIRNAAPRVFKDSSGLPQYAHWYVVWDRFAGYNEVIRTDVVYRAVKKALGPKEALKVVTAMGLTPEEAVNMGISTKSCP